MTSLTLGGCDGSLYIFPRGHFGMVDCVSHRSSSKMAGDNHERLFKRVGNIPKWRDYRRYIQ
jgi:hypothetical protein